MMNRNVIKLVLLALCIGAIIGVAVFRQNLDADSLDLWVKQWGVWGPVAFVAVYVVGTVAFLPGLLLTLTGGALFGPVFGTLYSLLGATIGASMSFLLARYLARDWVASRSARWLKRLMDGVDAEGWRFVALARLVPAFPFSLTNYALGLTRIGFWPYAITSAICMLPGAAAYSWLGHAGREAAAGNASAIKYGLIALAVLAAIAFLPRLIRQFRRIPEAKD